MTCSASIASIGFHHLCIALFLLYLHAWVVLLRYSTFCGNSKILAGFMCIEDCWTSHQPFWLCSSKRDFTAIDVALAIHTILPSVRFVLLYTRFFVTDWNIWFLWKGKDKRRRVNGRHVFSVCSLKAVLFCVLLKLVIEHFRVREKTSNDAFLCN